LEKESLDPSKRIAFSDDLIRTLAIFLVILLHAANDTLEASSVSANNYWTGIVYKAVSLSCVPLFVMLSGALLLQPAKLNEPIRVFLKKRLSRLGLAFAFWSVVYLAWSFYITQTPITFSNIGVGLMYDLFGGAYYPFWFIYLIVGLYLITPILRVLVAYENVKIIQYLLLLWFAGVAILPLIHMASGYTLNTGVFLIGGWIGYFVLGSYLQRLKFRSAILFGLLIIGFVWTIFGMWLLNYPLIGMQQTNYFLDY
jgi:surface polysaccharide O-acyltransferase-like enzyme